ncbi:hypothetical protein [Paracoccus salsus]|uniref:hypothetical protein n=1 Tax=Paracoccus salsus TaxID=2911061 RepID=UPI001F2EC90E|nr:hypothetical protein [Paracoccus salsus]MCF3975072.1 hypothetical protein [Paracoccus salsus]
MRLSQPARIYAEGLRHLASVRLRHACDGSMVERHFPVFWRRHTAALQRLPEVTRLCTAPHAASEWSATSQILLTDPFTELSP